MKSIFLIAILTLTNVLNLFSTETNLIQKAESVWVSKGLNVIFSNIQSDYKLTSNQFAYFKNKYSVQIAQDKREYFIKSENASFFSDSTNNVDDWLKSKQLYYYKVVDEYVKSEEFKKVENDAIQSMSFLPGCGNANCTNIGFELGDISTWNAYEGIACTDPDFGSSSCHGFTSTGLSTRVQIQTGAGFDPIVGAGIPVVAPGSTYSLRLENTLNGGDASKITRTFYVDASNSTYIYKYAVVLEDPGSSHADADKPYFSVKLYVLEDDCSNPTDSQINCASYEVFANPSNPELAQNFKQMNPPFDAIHYKGWTEVAIPLTDYIGKKLRIEFVVSDCALGGHIGYAYLDGECINSQPSIGPCVDGKRELTAPEGFLSYWWSGDEIDDSNYGKTIKAGGGIYNLVAKTVSGCFSNYIFNVDTCPYTLPPGCTISNLTIDPVSCNSTNNTYDLSGTITFSSAPSSGVLIISNGYLSQIYNLPLTSPFNFTFNNLMADGTNKTLKAVFYNSNFISPKYISCQSTTMYMAPNPCYTPPIPCENCLTSFNPEPGKYIISAWVKELGSPSGTDTYDDPYIEILFSGGTTVLPKMYASGKIIDGWQRVYYEFDIPIGAYDINVRLGATSNICLFDDIRIHPANGSFVSYVYDPVSLKLVATLDDNNYATIYEYDNEGTLIRVKKETERGIMTIKESRENSPKR
jgi:hypothetical protein